MPGRPRQRRAGNAEHVGLAEVVRWQRRTAGRTQNQAPIFTTASRLGYVPGLRVSESSGAASGLLERTAGIRAQSPDIPASVSVTVPAV